MKTEILYDEFLQIFRNIYVITNVSKLQSFQLRLLNLSLVLNVQLFSWKITDSDKCFYCKDCPETLEHIFFYCCNAQKMLRAVEELSVNYNHPFMGTFSAESVLFNNVDSNPDELINLLILLMKNMIYVNRCLKKRMFKTGITK